tara:strand:+ start:14467 stop:14667 length:201 start_codon:yes stop_codon:yes gene_type:complete
MKGKEFKIPFIENFKAMIGKNKIEKNPEIKFIKLIFLKKPKPAKTPLNNKFNDKEKDPIKNNRNKK